MVDFELVEQSSKFQSLEDDADAADDAGAVGDDVVSAAQDQVSSRGRHISRERVELQVVLARVVS